MNLPNRQVVRMITQRTLGYVSVPATVGMVALSIFTGFLAGWYVQESQEAWGVSILIALVFGLLIRQPVKLWMKWLDSKPEEGIVDSIMDHFTGLQAEYDEALSSVALQGSTPGTTKTSKNSFNDEDFDEHVKGQLLKLVKQARKEGIKVTTPQFVAAVLKSIH